MNIFLRYSIPGILKEYAWLIALLPAAIIGGAIAFPGTFLSNTNVIIGFCLFPFAIFTEGKQRFNYIYMAAILLAGALAYVYNVRMFYFFTLAFYILFILEMLTGKINFLILFLLIFMSPFFEQVSTILGFPIRLLLSSLAGNILSMAGLDITIAGNTMLLGGADFTVDEACMGLNMLSITMLMGVFAIAYQYKTGNTRLNILPLTLFFLAVFALNIFSNLLRIMILVVFKIMPEHPMHELAGILCLAVYVMIPIHFLAKWLIHRFGKTPATEKNTINTPLLFTKSIVTAFALFIIGLGLHIRDHREKPGFAYANVSLRNFQPVKIDKGITKMFDEKILVYVKPIPEFFTGEHTPLICWKGSGYILKNIQKKTVGSHEVYTGILQKSGAQLFTAWWYSNGEVQTIDQFDWRMRMLKGEERFCLINLTAIDENTLQEHLISILENGFLKISKQDDSCTL